MKCFIIFPHSYTEFQQLLVTEAQKYPSQVQEVLKTYDTSICKYFGVGRTPSKVCTYRSNADYNASILETKEVKDFPS